MNYNNTGCHLGMVDDRAGLFTVVERSKRKGIADNILGHIFFAYIVIFRNSDVIMYSKTGMLPPPDKVGFSKD